MNQEAQAELDRILGIEPVALSEAEVEFLRARRSYLTKEQTEKYADVLADKADKPVKEDKKADKADKPVKEDKKADKADKSQES